MSDQTVKVKREALLEDKYVRYANLIDEMEAHRVAGNFQKARELIPFADAQAKHLVVGIALAAVRIRQHDALREAPIDLLGLETSEVPVEARQKQVIRKFRAENTIHEVNGAE